LIEFFDRQLRQADTAWSVGSFGAIAEFMRDPDELVTFRHDSTAVSAVTARGGVRVSAQRGSRIIASESATADAWNHRIALCLPREFCAMNARRVLSEIGPDIDAIRAEEREGVLFDLGLGLLEIDACVRTTDSSVAAALRLHLGKSVFAADSNAIGVILDANPHRVFVSRVGRIEVFQTIPPPDGKSPDGPHTHLLPKLLAHGRTHAATEPVPDTWVPCAHCYPPNPVRDGQGRIRRFDSRSHDAFQAILEQYGDPERLALKKRLIDAVIAGHEPFAITGRRSFWACHRSGDASPASDFGCGVGNACRRVGPRSRGVDRLGAETTFDWGQREARPDLKAGQSTFALGCSSPVRWLSSDMLARDEATLARSSNGASADQGRCRRTC
jgi:hypothetical protein